MPKNKKISLKEIRTISRMLTQKVDASTIAKKTKRSKTTVERVRADYRAITFNEPLSHIDKGEVLPDIEYQDAVERVRGIPPMVRTAIIKGIADTIAVEDIVDPGPLDPRLAFAPQQVEPEHKPPSRLETQTNRKKLR